MMKMTQARPYRKPQSVREDRPKRTKCTKAHDTSMHGLCQEGRDRSEPQPKAAAEPCRVRSGLFPRLCEGGSRVVCKASRAEPERGLRGWGFGAWGVENSALAWLA